METSSKFLLFCTKVVALAISLALVIAFIPSLAFGTSIASYASKPESQTIGESIISEEIEGCICEIDTNGKLTIRPSNGTSGNLDFASSEWASFRDWYKESIQSVTIRPGVSAADSLAGMFWSCKSLETADLNGLSTSEVTNMARMFERCDSLKSVNLSALDTTKVTDMSAMFNECFFLETLSLPTSGTSVLVNMSQMIRNCPLITALDFSGFNTSNVSNMNNMLDGCISLASIKLGSDFKFLEKSWGNYLPKGNWLSEKTGNAFTTDHIERDRGNIADAYILQTGDHSSLINAIISPIPPQTYTGSPICPELSIMLDGTTLREGRDYLPSYYANENCGTALIAVAGNGSYSGARVIKFEIISPTIEIDTVELNTSAFTFNRNNQKPEITVKAGDKVIEPSNYDISWPSDIKNVGSKTITITGKGNYSGSLSATYTISPAKISSVSLQETKYTYDGSQKKPLVSVYSDSEQLAEGSDYIITWPSDLINAGKKNVIITGKGNYAGTLSAGYEIAVAQSKPDPTPVDPIPVDPKPVDPAPSNPEPADPTPIEPQPSDPTSTITMFRLYNPNSGEHFYTASTVERDAVIAAGWNDEGIGWTAPTEGIQVYRLYNSFAGEHHYTFSEIERDALVDVGWTDEGIGWFSDPNENVPLYRAYNPNAFANNHHYTAELGEFIILLNLGWYDEGIGWYAAK